MVKRKRFNHGEFGPCLNCICLKFVNVKEFQVFGDMI